VLYSLYPNPVTAGILNIAPVSGSSATHTCLAYTIRPVATGAIVLQGQVSRSSGQRAPSQINVSSLSSGLYIGHAVPIYVPLCNPLPLATLRTIAVFIYSSSAGRHHALHIIF
jgi:hypothetical protein